jgi:hypothetical protein
VGSRTAAMTVWEGRERYFATRARPIPVIGLMVKHNVL